ncbi:unnamed protein product [Didymodactylos carnosus]|uniref:Uncharacterized protein n=1 Tax=Didymodactylos carnosus TaxID=1234261 RepID=A0A815IMH6_9BILA|nr:unnamed protein product [Didymodactylos carnosus]CAF1370793.1 unnamed protein product [Didymodactylos carnosus]CAF3891672.1 unnamed protein product [Didymodactylos carnosus]CAF4256941.1 unnamed protein product [Didymodactylos carnosus]
MIISLLREQCYNISFLGTTTPVVPTTTIYTNQILNQTSATTNRQIYLLSSPLTASPLLSQVSALYIAQSTYETLTFGIRNDPGYTWIDNISVLSNGHELLVNGNFEYANNTGWQGASHLGNTCGVCSSYCYNDGVTGNPDYVSQTFQTTPGSLLYISFYIGWSGSGSAVLANVTIYP